MNTATISRTQDKIFRFPTTGKVLKQVRLEGGEGIRIRSGDTLIGFSIAMFNGDATHANEFGIYDPSKKKVVQLLTLTKLTPGSVIVHIPSSKDAQRDVPTLAPISKKDHARIVQAFCVELRMPTTTGNVVSWAARGLSLARLSALLTELAGKVTLGATGTAGANLGLAAGGACFVGTVFAVLQFAAPFLNLLASYFAINKSVSAAWRNTFNVGYAYGLTAWIFEKKQPAISPKIRKNINVRPNEVGNHISAWNRAAAKAYRTDGPALAKKSGMSPDLFRLLMRGTFRNNPSTYCYFVMGSMAQRAPKIEKAHLLNYRATNIVYPY